MRRIFGGVILTSVLAALIAPVSVGAIAQPPGTIPFSGYATGSALHINALQLAAAGPVIENTTVGFSGASVNSQGQGTAINNEMGLGVQPANAARESYGRGSGLEAGVAKALPNNPDTNQVIPGALAEAGATPLEPAAGAPNTVQTALVTKELTKQTVAPVAYASLLRGQAQAMWNENSALAMLGNPMGFGLGYADDVQLVNTGAAADEGFLAPLAGTNTSATSGERTTSQTLSATYLVNNGDGTCGVASETRITVAPVRLNLPPDTNAANDITIEVLGEFILRAVATGKGPGTITYAPAAGGPEEPIVRIIMGTTVTNVLTTQDLFGETGLVLPDALPAPLGTALSPLFAIAVGEDPRAIETTTTSNPDAKSQPTTTITEASAAADILRIRLIQPSPDVAGLNALDLRLGHFETKAVVPEGGLNCEIPVKKDAQPNPASVGDTITFTITIPSSADILIPFPCELSNIRVVDVTSVKTGNPRFTVLSGTGPNGEVGVVNGDTITFENIGNYKPGDPPLEVKVLVRLDGGAGELQDDATVTATPANCKAQANAVGQAFGGDAGLAGLAGLTGSGLAGGGGAGLTGTGHFDGPGTGELPRTGPSDTLPIVIAVGGLTLALAFRGLRRRGSSVTS